MNTVSLNQPFNPPLLDEVLSVIKSNAVELDPFAVEVLKEMADGDGRISRFRLIDPNAAEMKFSLDFSSLGALRFQADPDQVRIGLNNKTIAALVTVFDMVAQEAAQRRLVEVGAKVCAYIASIDLSSNMVSGKSLLWFYFAKDEESQVDTLRTRVKWEILSNIEGLKMNGTLVSSLGLKYACLMTRLKSLSLDFCPRVDSILNPETTGIPSLESLSVIGTAVSIGTDEMFHLAVKFPHLTHLEYTQKPSEENKPQKVLGITDPITMATVIDPVLYGCGHLTGRKEAVQMKECYSQCDSAVGGQFRPLLTRLEKNNSHWQVKLIDYKRRDLSDSIFYHAPCGALFAHETVKEIFASFKKEIAASSGEELPICPACIANPVTGASIPLQLQQIYPELTSCDIQEKSQSMQNLYQQSTYIIV